jgi:hypothetical protein
MISTTVNTVQVGFYHYLSLLRLIQHAGIMSPMMHYAMVSINTILKRAVNSIILRISPVQDTGGVAAHLPLILPPATTAAGVALDLDIPPLPNELAAHDDNLLGNVLPFDIDLPFDFDLPLFEWLR